MTALEVIRDIRAFGIGTFEGFGNETVSWRALDDLLDRLERQAQEDERRREQEVSGAT